MKTSDLVGVQLDLAVALVAGLRGRLDERGCVVDGAVFRPSVDWGQGGPVLESNRIELNPPAPNYEGRE